MTVGVPFLVLSSCLHRMYEIVDADTFEFESLAAGAGHRHRSHSWFLRALREFAETCENVTATRAKPVLSAGKASVPTWQLASFRSMSSVCTSAS